MWLPGYINPESKGCAGCPSASTHRFHFPYRLERRVMDRPACSFEARSRVNLSKVSSLFSSAQVNHECELDVACSTPSHRCRGA